MGIGKLLLGAATAASIAASAPAAAAEPATAGPPASAEQFEAAMAKLDHRRASRIFDALVGSHRLAHPEGRPDPLLNGMAGRLFLKAGKPAAALAYLRRSDGADLPAPPRIAAALARAEAEEALGDWEGAVATLARLLTLPLDPGRQLSARLGLARVRMLDEPTASLAAAQALAGAAPAGRRWEAELVAAQALSLLGRAAEADAAASRAWADAAEAATAAAAPMRVALVRAGLAAASGRRDALMAMLSAANASVNRVDTDLAESAPVCGESGITPSDYATFGAYTGVEATQWLAPVSASRPAAAAVFRRSLAARQLLAVTGTPPGGVIFTIRCRTVPSADYAPPFPVDPWAQWFADRGLYFVMGADFSLEEINRLSDEIAELRAKFGDDHPSLIPLRLILLASLEHRAASATDVSEWQVAELRKKIGSALAKAGGAEGLMPDPEMAAEQARIGQAASFEQGMAIYRGSVERLIAKLPADVAYPMLREWLKMDGDAPEAMRRRIVQAMLARASGGAGDPLRRALQRRLGEIALKAGNAAEARAAFADASGPRDACGAMEKPPQMEEHGISDEDYPSDAIEPSIEGTTVLELDVGADGRVVRSRTLLASPSLVFDPLVEAKVAAFRLAPATERGRARACRAAQQAIRWQMPREESPGPPTFAPVPDGET